MQSRGCSLARRGLAKKWRAKTKAKKNNLTVVFTIVKENIERKA
jgi:hypothetical protein